MKVTRTTERLANMLLLSWQVAEQAGSKESEAIEHSGEEALVFGKEYASNAMLAWNDSPRRLAPTD